MERHITLEQLDFRLLKAFLTLLEVRHVGRAADVLGMSQPAMSMLLARLRQVSGDALFVRGHRQMQPTPLARRWAQPVRSALTGLERALNEREDFVDAQSRRGFVLYMSDAGHAMLFGSILRRAQQQAPHVRLEAVNRWDGSLADRLDDGSIDLALGWLPQLEGRKACTALFKDHYVGMRAAGKAADANRPARGYAVASMIGTPHESVIDRFVRRSIEPAVVVPTFYMLPEVLPGTGLTGIAPSTLARIFAQRSPGSLQIVKPPVALPALDVRLYWSSSAHRDTGLAWLRDIVIGCTAESVGAPTPARARPVRRAEASSGAAAAAVSRPRRTRAARG